jgi:hypothetical protein
MQGYTAGDRVTMRDVPTLGVIVRIDETRPFGLIYLIDYQPTGRPVHGGTVRNGHVREWFSRDEFDTTGGA